MLLEIKWNEAVKSVACEITQSAVFKEIGKVIYDLATEAKIPNRVEATGTGISASFQLIKRGTYIKGGVTYPSVYVTEDYCRCSLSDDDYDEAYLTCVNPESNNFKFYHLKPRFDGIHATYGRIGSQRGEAFGEKDLQNPYPTYMYWIRYYEKLSKGYIDQSDIYLKGDVVTAKKPAQKISAKTEADRLYEKLLAFAKRVVDHHLASPTKITKNQVREGRKIYRTMAQRKTISSFNKWMLKLATISPRRCRYVSELLATSPNDFGRILDREDELLCAMESILASRGDMPTPKTSSDLFGKMGVSVKPASKEEEAKVLGRLPANLRNLAKRVYRVIPGRQQKSFDAYLKKNKIRHVRQFWHGSRNENWLSIIQNGLKLNPDAQITGKMLGNGIYFAPDAGKSWGYTSWMNSRWANGNASTAFMGLYATAYGNPLQVGNNIRQYTKAELDRAKKSCVYAKRGAGNFLKMDEVVFYDEDAMVLTDIVEFST